MTLLGDEDSSGARVGGSPGHDEQGGPADQSPTRSALAMRQLEVVRSETRAEIGLLHDRVNALVASEAFLTVGYAVTMSNGAAWGRSFALIVAPVLAVLGLLLALFAELGVAASARLVLEWTQRQGQMLDAHPELSDTFIGWAAGGGSRHSAYADQRRSLLFFRAVPLLFTAAWTVLTVVALVVER